MISGLGLCDEYNGSIISPSNFRMWMGNFFGVMTILSVALKSRAFKLSTGFRRAFATASSTTTRSFLDETGLNIITKHGEEPKKHGYDYHIPVMKDECMQYLAIKEGGIYVDCTMGGGGHTRAILERGGRVIGLDQDPDAVMTATVFLQDFITKGQLEVIPINFRNIKEALCRSIFAKGQPIDGVLIDLGISSYQIDEASRGFSFGADGPLDMRMHQGMVDNTLIGSDRSLTAAKIVNEWNQDDIANILFHYGDETRSRVIAREIVANRPIHTTGALMTLISRVTSFKDRHKTLARCFQALRIVVNDELGALDQVLMDAKDCVKIGGRLVVISYHSLEDRRVKRLMRNGILGSSFEDSREVDVGGDESDEGVANMIWKPVVRKAIKPTTEEVEKNRRSRSARLRVAERIDINGDSASISSKPKMGNKQIRKFQEKNGS